jgi:hypothetical protein
MSDDDEQHRIALDIAVSRTRERVDVANIGVMKAVGRRRPASVVAVAIAEVRAALDELEAAVEARDRG